MRLPPIAHLTRWSRADGAVLEGLLGLAFVVQAVFGLIGPLLAVAGLLDPATSRSVSLSGTTAADIAAADGIKLSTSDQAQLTIAHPDVYQRALLELPTLIGAAMIMLGISLLFLLTRTLRQGDPFASGNPRRLHGIALLILVGGVFGNWLEAITSSMLVSGTSLQDRIPTSFQISPVPVMAALLVAALAEAFRLGTRLREDTEGLV
ncbi:DUF2975 domain-containing protein [Actinomadura sp. 6N118]|uniref:DUF2975 domain-containing protein n=1 Tax=Actinomadura sp. 6N118 TaxID=3375151 RepID=UPI0037BD58A3